MVSQQLLQTALRLASLHPRATRSISSTKRVLRMVAPMKVSQVRAASHRRPMRPICATQMATRSAHTVSPRNRWIIYFIPSDAEERTGNENYLALIERCTSKPNSHPLIRLMWPIVLAACAGSRVPRRRPGGATRRAGYQWQTCVFDVR